MGKYRQQVSGPLASFGRGETKIYVTYNYNYICITCIITSYTYYIQRRVFWASSKYFKVTLLNWPPSSWYLLSSLLIWLTSSSSPATEALSSFCSASRTHQTQQHQQSQHRWVCAVCAPWKRPSECKSKLKPFSSTIWPIQPSTSEISVTGKRKGAVQNDYPPRIVDGKKVVRQVHTHLTSSLHTYFMQINVTTCEFYAMHSCLTVVRMQARNTALIINPHPQGALELRWMAPVFLIKLSTSLRTRIHLISIHVCIDVHIDLFPVCVLLCV